MFHYELVFMISPKNIYIKNIINHYLNLIKGEMGIIHRLEDWGLKYLAYAIKKFYKAYYVLMNIEIYKNSLIKIVDDLKVNNNIIRFLILRKKNAEKNVSVMLLQKFNAVNK